MESGTNAVTVLYYEQDDMVSLCSDVLTNVRIEADKRVIFPESFRDNKIIIAVLDGNCHVRNSLGDRPIYASS
ncbi:MULTISPECIES: DUF2375 family protein [unclassified Thalassotalea]|uniref:DUF2375 family protein n=1 Tax=unclassified Thalassotalea TaxID=2614972 RepID=UPI001080A9EE|nr:MULTISPECIES: DUF2375 family protein [unclassified Thalassotalea]NMP17237.1 DUF2375 family protein [Thalassotalea sp. Y01]QBY03837.1 DUF2375 domain-containing protein [Thalassotalea sp. HSM 43]